MDGQPQTATLGRDLRRGSSAGPGAHGSPRSRSAALLRVELSDVAAAAHYVQVLGNLLASDAEELTVIDVQGRAHADVGVEHLGQLWGSGRIAVLQFRRMLSGEPGVLAITQRNGQPSFVHLRMPFSEVDRPTGTLWLQRAVERAGPLPILAVPIDRGAFSVEAANAFVAVAARLGGLVRADLEVDGAELPSRTWSAGSAPTSAQHLVSSQDQTVWGLGTGVDAREAPQAWSAGREAPASPSRATPEWWSRLEQLTRAPLDLAALGAHLETGLCLRDPFRLIDLREAPPAAYMVPEEQGVVLALIPTAMEIVVALDLLQPSELLASAVVHAMAHLSLGHVRAGDRWGHWDTARTLLGSSSHRLWDQEAQAEAVKILGARPTRRVASIDDCTASEKAQLGLCRMIGEMLGESRKLHPTAERYQRAAYQRRAAERLVSMLEDYGGAMLCDGVGLGKTYVATTLIVHYANLWREALGPNPERLADGPYRITVLAPYAVVSTWRREALPPLAAFGVPPGVVRVLSHTQLSRMTRASELLTPVNAGWSDLEHLLLSDLVIVDEAHNFRSLAARRTKVLRDLLRLQPQRDTRRRVVLLTATPVNNSLEDLRQEVSLLFSQPIWLGEGKKEAYRRQVVKEIRERLTKARNQAGRGDIAPLVIHGRADAKFSDAIDFRDDLDFGPNVKRIGDYLQEQDKRLKELQERIRAAAQNGQPLREDTAVRIAEDLLDRIVVQRSRALCKDIEAQQGGAVELLFRPDAGRPEKLPYSDEYDGIEDVLSRFLPLFDTTEPHDTGNGKTDRGGSGTRPLSFKVYMWYDVRTGIKAPTETSSVIGLQRILALKRLESSPVSFLITLVRLTVLHAHRLEQLCQLCLTVADPRKHKDLRARIDSVLARQRPQALANILSLAAVQGASGAGADFLRTLSAAYSDSRPAADTDDPPPQLTLFDDGTTPEATKDELGRLWELRDALLADFETLLLVTPDLTDIVFGKFERAEWPRRFIAGGEAIDWPASAKWGLRLVTDAKLRKLVGRLVTARRTGQKVVVFSQFSDTIAYIRSVLRACSSFTRADWQMVVRGGLGVDHLHREELTGLLAVTATVTGATEDRDDVVNDFAPYYRIGPHRPPSAESLIDGVDPQVAAWEAAWERALGAPVDVLLATDVLAEGVNLQDAALLVNFDVHWNPVRMIQRAGRIDRRLNPGIEHAAHFPEIVALAAQAGKPVPRYYWHDHPGEAPVTVNMILPDELEAELLLRERLATKTLAIDFTLGLEQGTGAEADWMEDYKYQGVTSLNSFQKDRAIEQISGHHERLSRRLASRGIVLEWAEALNGWFRDLSAGDAAPITGRVKLGRRDTPPMVTTRYLEPVIADGVPCWLWSQTKPGRSVLNFWLQLDAKTFPPVTRTDLPWNETSSVPVSAQHLLAAVQRLETASLIELTPAQVGRPLLQGVTAFSAGYLGSEADRRVIRIESFFLLQLVSWLPPETVSVPPPRLSEPPVS